LVEETKGCYKLRKALYGLKQAPREWNRMLSERMQSAGFESLYTDACVYKHHTSNVFCLVYVDDILIIYEPNSRMEAEKIKQFLRENFKVKDLGELAWFLGIEIIRKDGTMTLSQKEFTKSLLNEFGMSQAKPAVTPWAPGLIIGGMDDNNDINEEDKTTFRRLVGKLLYLSSNTRPDIARAVQELTKVQDNPTSNAIQLSKRIMRYLNRTTSFGIVYSRESPTVACYSDSDWASDVIDRKSTSGCVIMYTGGPVIWFAKKQSVVTVSSAEAEYVALYMAAKQCVWVQSILQELRLPLARPITIYEDNTATINIAENPVLSEKTKHISIKFHYTRDIVKEKHVVLAYCPTEKMIADILTKPLDSKAFEYLRSMLHVEEACWKNNNVQHSP
jgi:hypothetical protein